MSEGEIDAGHYYSKSFYKVLIFCDKTYTEKANNRTGGVGDETVIISSEVYGKVTQEKFIPIITERDEDGKEYVPAYIKTRIYIDFSNPDLFRWNADDTEFGRMNTDFIFSIGSKTSA